MTSHSLQSESIQNRVAFFEGHLVTRNTANIVCSFLYGFIGPGLFRKFEYPGASNEFVDSRILEEIRQTGEIDRNIRR